MKRTPCAPRCGLDVADGIPAGADRALREEIHITATAAPKAFPGRD
ncbi:hypothetical protein [Sphaerisporangium album]|nr:hypothetical protein [Sphaerisporangium album]